MPDGSAGSTPAREADNSRAAFLVGDNGTGKSTLVEGIAVAAGFNAEGGSRSFRFATRATESSLGDQLVLRRGIRKPRNGFFLRAESYYNVASEIERLDRDPGSPPLLPAYGGISPHERSPGQSFLDLVTHRRAVPAGRAGGGAVPPRLHGTRGADRGTGRPGKQVVTRASAAADSGQPFQSAVGALTPRRAREVAS